MDSKKLALLCRELADNKKAEGIVVLDVRKISSVTDYFVIASGSSEPHLRAIMDEIADTLREDHNVTPTGKDGTVSDAWVVLAAPIATSFCQRSSNSGCDSARPSGRPKASR